VTTNETGDRGTQDEILPWIERAREIPLRVVSARVRLRAGFVGHEPPCAKLRGLMGDKFRALRCLTGAARCTGCLSALDCDFASLFGAPDAGVEGDEPRPFWLRGIPAEPIELGAVHTARLVFVEDAAPAVEALVVAWVDALERLGTNAHQRNEVTELEAAAWQWPVSEPHTVRALRIRCETPLVLRGDLAKSRENCPGFPPLMMLASAGLRRIAMLLEAFDGAPPARVRLPSARQVIARDDHFRPWRSERVSRRQGRAIPIEAWHGSVELEGDELASFVPLLQTLSVLQVGKATSQGFGAFALEVQP
jgi:hypothetical protein